MSSALDVLQKYNGGDFIVLERELRRLPRSSLTLPDGPSGMRLLEPLVVALHNVRSSAGVVALNILGILACDPDNRDALLNATEFQGESLENVWGESVGGARGDAKGEDEVADGGDRNGFDDLDADDRIRAALLVLLYRLANYHLDPHDILALTSGASVTGSSDSAGAGGDGDDMNHVHIGVASVVGALGRLLRTPDLEPPLQAAAVTTLGKLALPDTYHRSTFEDNQGPVTSTNDVAISKLSRIHVTGVNALIQRLIEARLLDHIARVAVNTLRRRAQRLKGALPESSAQEEESSLDNLMQSSLVMVHNLLLFGSQYQAQLRQHIACETAYIAAAALPYVRARLDAYLSSASSQPGAAPLDAAAKDAGRAVILGMRCFVVACFKIKVHRQTICEEGIVRRLLVEEDAEDVVGTIAGVQEEKREEEQSKEEAGDVQRGHLGFHEAQARRGRKVSRLDVLFAGRPQLRGAALATALKLHVNVEGGFGPTWALQHASTVEAILAAVDKLDDTALKGFARCLAGEDALPVSRASRAYPALKPVFDHALSCCPALSLQAACSPTAHRKKKKSKNKRNKNKFDTRSAYAQKRNQNNNNSAASCSSGDDKETLEDNRNYDEATDDGGFPVENKVQSKIPAYFPPTAEAKGSPDFHSQRSREKPSATLKCSDEKHGSACDAGRHDHDDDYNNENNDDNNEEEEEEEGLGGAIWQYAMGGVGLADEASTNSNLTPTVTDSILSTAALTEARGTQNEAQGPSQPDGPPPAVGWLGPDRFRATRPWAPRVLPSLGAVGEAAQERATQAGLAFADESAESRGSST